MLFVCGVLLTLLLILINIIVKIITIIIIIISIFTIISVIVSSDRSSYSDDGLLYVYPRLQPLSQIFTQSIDAIDVTSVILSRLNSINAFDVTRCKLMLIEC